MKFEYIFEGLFLLLIVNFVKCSENNVNLSISAVEDVTEAVSITDVLAKPQLIRQRNTPRSQSTLQAYCQRRAAELGIEIVEYSKLTLADAWRHYVEEGDDLLICLMESEGFNPNSFIDGWDTILISAIKINDLDLVKRLLRFPDLDINYPGLSGHLPLELALDHPTIFNTILNEAPGLDILRKNPFGENVIQRAMAKELFGMADQLLKEVRLHWIHLSEAQREEIIALQDEYYEAWREYRIKLRENKSKKD